MIENNKISAQRERQAWIALGEITLAELWDNPQDDKILKKYS